MARAQCGSAPVGTEWLRPAGLVNSYQMDLRLLPDGFVTWHPVDHTSDHEAGALSMAAGARRPNPHLDGDPADWPFVQPSGDRAPWEEDAQLRSAFDDAAIGMSIANLNWGLLR